MEADSLSGSADSAVCEVETVLLQIVSTPDYKDGSAILVIPGRCRDPQTRSAFDVFGPGVPVQKGCFLLSDEW
jgi:hypothetical protein